MNIGCSLCAYGWQLFAVTFLLLLLSFAWHVLIPSLLTGSLESLKKKYNKSGKAWAVVTGTTSGIGSVFVALLARLGFNVLMIARNEQKLKEMKSNLVSSKGTKNTVKIEYIVMDLAKKGPLVSSASELSTFLASNEVSILVNNAGLNTEFPKSFLDNSLDEMESIMDVNCRAVTVLTHAILPTMIKNRNGLVINISSLLGQSGAPLFSVYSGTKNFIDAFSLSLKEELRGTGVSVFCSIPGFVVSNMSKIKRTSLSVISPEVCAETILKQVAGGKLSIAAPHWTHALIRWLFTCVVPQFITLRLMGRILKATNKAAVKKLAKKA